MALAAVDTRTPAQRMWADERQIARDLRVRDQLEEELALLERRREELTTRLAAVRGGWRVQNHHLLDLNESENLPMFGPGTRISSLWCFADDRHYNWFAYVAKKGRSWIMVGFVGKGVTGGGCSRTPELTFDTKDAAIEAAAYFASHGEYKQPDGQVVRAWWW